jgi:hypothetical protein
MSSTAFFAVAAVATIASTGIQMYSAQQAASSQAAIANYNNMINQQNAQWQQMAAQRAADTAAFNAQLQMLNAESQRMQAQFNQQSATFSNEQFRMQADFVDMQVQLQRNTAAMMRQQSDGEMEQAQRQADNIRKEKARILGLQRSQYAKGGVLTSAGSSLAVLSETADLFEMQALDTRLLANLSANRLTYEAGVTDFNAGITALEAAAMRDQANINEKAIEFNLNQDLFAANLNYSAARMSLSDALFEREAAGAGYRIAMRQAELERMAGMAQSRASQMGVWGSLVGGAAQLGSLGLAYYGTRPATPQPTGAGRAIR